jgi:hypothetical protein
MFLEGVFFGKLSRLCAIGDSAMKGWLSNSDWLVREAGE